MEDVLETLEDLSRHGFNVWDSWTIKSVSSKSNNPSLTNTFEQDQKKTKGQCVDDMETKTVPATDRANVMPAKTGTTVNVSFFNVSDYHQANSFVRIVQIEDTDNLLCDESSSNVTSLRASFRMYASDYSRSRVSMTFYHDGER